MRIVFSEKPIGRNLSLHGIADPNLKDEDPNAEAARFYDPTSFFCSSSLGFECHHQMWR